MKSQRIWWGAAASVVFCWGCTAPAPDGGPDPAAVEARLGVLDTRLERLEQTVGDFREDQRRRGEAHDQSLVEINRDLRDTREAVAGLRSKVETPIRVGYRPVDVVFGALPGGNEPLTYLIPAVIPDTAREILVYAQVATGYVEGGPHQFRIATRLEDGREAAFYLYAVGGSQRSWAYNSDTVWLPMPKNRELRVQTANKPFFGDWNSEVRIIAYR